MHQAKNVAELIKEAQLHPIQWFIPGILMQDGVHILHGKEESFKTMLTVQLLEALVSGGEFLMQAVPGGLRVGMVELEEKPSVFGSRMARFFVKDTPEIHVLPAGLRLEVLSGYSPEKRIGLIAQWAHDQQLHTVAIDSVVKLFPARCDLNKPTEASEVFNQLQQLPTPWILAHDRKSQEGLFVQSGNAEIVGSGRFAQDPDIIHQLVRPDGRAPMATFNWGKVRDGEKCPPIALWFDRIDFRLYPLHPYLHLLRSGPKLESEIVTEAQRRYGWQERRARESIATLQQMKDAAGEPVIEADLEGHSKRLELVGAPAVPES